MRWTCYKAVIVGATALSFYVAGISYGAIKEKGYVSVYDLKKAIASLVEDVSELKTKVNMLFREVVKTSGEVEKLKRDFSLLSSQVKSESKPRVMKTIKDWNRVRLYPWGKIIGSVPRGVKVVVFTEEGDWYLTNLGYMHKSLFAEGK